MEALCCAGTNAEKGQDSSETKTNTMGKTGLPLRFPTDLEAARLAINVSRSHKVTELVV